MDGDEYPEATEVELLARLVLAVVDKLDHIHDDLVALRAAKGIPRPECYAPVAGHHE